MGQKKTDINRKSFNISKKIPEKKIHFHFLLYNLDSCLEKALIEHKIHKERNIKKYRKEYITKIKKRKAEAGKDRKKLKYYCLFPNSLRQVYDKQSRNTL